VEWLSRGLVVTDQTNCTEDDVCDTVIQICLLFAQFSKS